MNENIRLVRSLNIAKCVACTIEVIDFQINVLELLQIKGKIGSLSNRLDEILSIHMAPVAGSGY